MTRNRISSQGFERTATGYRATDAKVAWWASRDTCPACGTVVEPAGKTSDGRWRYECYEGLGETTEWTSFFPANTAGLG